jgi:hypothetical protein
VAVRCIKERADERTRTADLSSLRVNCSYWTSNLLALHHFDLRPVYWAVTKVQADTIFVHVLSNTRK